jgi:hypothetical protein
VVGRGKKQAYGKQDEFEPQLIDLLQR